jgi:flagellar biosynthesis GTPase FlhF
MDAFIAQIEAAAAAQEAAAQKAALDRARQQATADAAKREEAAADATKREQAAADATKREQAAADATKREQAAADAAKREQAAADAAKREKAAADKARREADDRAARAKEAPPSEPAPAPAPKPEGCTLTGTWMYSEDETSVTTSFRQSGTSLEGSVTSSDPQNGKVTVSVRGSVSGRNVRLTGTSATGETTFTLAGAVSADCRSMDLTLTTSDGDSFPVKLSRRQGG